MSGTLAWTGLLLIVAAIVGMAAGSWPPSVGRRTSKMTSRSRVMLPSSRSIVVSMRLTSSGSFTRVRILLQAKSRHQDPRTLARYAKPGIEAVAALTTESDRGRRHRQ